MLATARLTGQTAGATMVAILFAWNPAGGGESKALVAAAAIALLGGIASASRLLTPGADP